MYSTFNGDRFTHLDEGHDCDVIPEQVAGDLAPDSHEVDDASLAGSLLVAHLHDALHTPHDRSHRGRHHRVAQVVRARIKENVNLTTSNDRS